MESNKTLIPKFLWLKFPKRKLEESLKASVDIPLQDIQTDSTTAVKDLTSIGRVPEIQEPTPIQTTHGQQTEASAVEGDETAPLWDMAYNSLKKQHTSLIYRYEMILSAILKREIGKHYQLDDRTKWVIQTDTMARRSQMARALEIWLKRSNERGVGYKDFVGALLEARSLNKIMGNLTQGSSSISLVWLAICLGIEATIHDGLPRRVAHSAAIYVASRMQWYLSLPNLISNNKNATENPSDTIGQRAKEFKIAIINLYKTILHIQIIAACSSSEYIPSTLGIGSLEAMMCGPHQYYPTKQDLVELENALAVCLNGKELENQLRQLLEVAQLRGDDVELIPKLHVFHKPGSSYWDFLRDFSLWEIPHNVDFTSKNSDRVFWVPSDGTGKTVLLQSIVQRFSDPLSKLGSEPMKNVAYLFCGSELKIQQRSSTSVVRSLIWQILQSQPSLSKHMEHKLSSTMRNDFDDPNDFYALSTLLCTLIKDDQLNMTYFVLDGLEELCGEVSDNSQDSYRDDWGLTGMIRLICANSRLSDRVKWLVSSNEDVRRRIDNDLQHYAKIPQVADISYSLASHGNHAVSGTTPAETLSPNAREISNTLSSIRHTTPTPQLSVIHIASSLSSRRLRRAVDQYTSLKVRDLASRFSYGGDLQLLVTEKLKACSGGSWLWVDLACDIIESKGVPWSAPGLIEELKPNVAGLYSQMQSELKTLRTEDTNFRNKVLSTAAIAFRPLSLLELSNLVDFPAEVNLEIVIEKMCFAFLEITEEKVCFKNLAARRHLRKHMEETNGLSLAHEDMVRKCLRVAFDGKKSQLTNYATIYWIRHLSAIRISDVPQFMQSTMELVNKLLKDHFLQWLETLVPQRLLVQVHEDLQRLETTWIKKTTEELRLAHNSDGYNNAGSLTATALFQNIRSAIRFLDYRRDLNIPEGMSPHNTLLFCPDIDELKDLVPLRWGPLDLATGPIIRPPTGGSDSSRVLTGHLDPIEDCAYSLDGRLIASISGKSLRLWDSNTGKAQHVLEVAASGYDTAKVVFSPDCCGMLASATDPSKIQLWTVSTGAPSKVLTPASNSGPIIHFTFSSKGDYLIAVTYVNVIRWQFPYYRRSKWLDLEKEMWGATGACFSSNESLLALTTAQCRIILWDMEKVKVRHRLIGHDKKINCISFSPDSILLASCSDDHSVRIWNTENGEMISQLRTFQNRVSSLAFSPDGVRLACGSDRYVQVWKATRLRRDIVTYETDSIFGGHHSSVTAVRFSCDGRHILSSSADKTIRIRRINRLELSATAKDDLASGQAHSTADSTDSPQAIPEYHNGAVTFVAFSPQGTMVGSASSAPKSDILLWDADKGTPLRIINSGHTRDIRSLTFTQDGNTLVSASDDYTIRLWDIHSGNLVCKLEGHTGWIRGTTVSPDSRFIASASDDMTVCIWDIMGSLKGKAPAGEYGNNNPKPKILSPYKTLPGYGKRFECVAFSPNSQYLATGGDWEYPVLIWDLEVMGYTNRGEDFGQPKQQQNHEKIYNNNIDQFFSILSRPSTLSSICSLVFAPPTGDTLIAVSTSRAIYIWKATAEPQATGTQDWQLTYTIDGNQAWPHRMFRFPYFDAERPDVLLSENGALLVRTASSWADASLMMPGPRAQYGVLDNYLGQTWITKNNKTLIFVPSRYRKDTYTFQVKGERVVIGCKSGDVLIFKFRDF
ncbi:hypothetical protein GGS24DRAFT_511741 [Hypoxylon argillaceum]|nr:hypothetical protein GGS24DRAFT_511741 [Hypoxylon argillaceum]